MASEVGYLYFIIEDDNTVSEKRIKIGVSKDIDKRYKKYTTENPHNPKIYKLIKAYNYFKLERLLHKEFDQYRIEGSEWFKITTEQVDNICALIDFSTENIVGFQTKTNSVETKTNSVEDYIVVKNNNKKSKKRKTKNKKGNMCIIL
jgi:hypothetical protein